MHDSNFTQLLNKTGFYIACLPSGQIQCYLNHNLVCKLPSPVLY